MNDFTRWSLNRYSWEVKMNMVIRIGLIILLIPVFVGCTTYSLVSRVDQGQEKSVVRGETMVTDKINNIGVTLLVRRVDKYHKHSVLIENYNNEKIFFNEKYVKVYQGNIESNTWKEIKTYTAGQFYEKRKNEIEGKASSMAFTADIKQIFNSSENELSASIKRIADQQQINRFVDSGSNELSNLQETLLYSSDIPPFSSYWGVVFSKDALGPDYKIVIYVEGQQFNFFYSRADREEFIDRYSEKDRAQHLVFFKVSHDDINGLGYGFYPQRIGFSLALMGEEADFGDYESTDSVTINANGEVEGTGTYDFSGDTLVSVGGIDLEINTKISKFMWLNAGIGFNKHDTYMLFDHYDTSGEFNERRWILKDYELSFDPKIGLDVLYGHFFIKSGLVLSDLHDLGVEFGLGYVF
jgi:hypothetical protein